MRNLHKLTFAMLMTAGLSGSALAAGADTEKGQTPAAPAAAGADNQPDKPETAVISHSATVIKNGSKEEEKGAGSGSANPSQSPVSGQDDGDKKP
jgi:hypothetical protein